MAVLEEILFPLTQPFVLILFMICACDGRERCPQQTRWSNKDLVLGRRR